MFLLTKVGGTCDCLCVGVRAWPRAEKNKTQPYCGAVGQHRGSRDPRNKNCHRGQGSCVLYTHLPMSVHPDGVAVTRPPSPHCARWTSGRGLLPSLQTWATLIAGALRLCVCFSRLLQQSFSIRDKPARLWGEGGGVFCGGDKKKKVRAHLVSREVKCEVEHMSLPAVVESTF
jgi:hypothetical protein